MTLEDLPSENTDSSTASDSGTLSESHHDDTVLCCHYGIPLCIGIADLYKAKVLLKSLVDRQSLGVALGLLYPSLEIIERENSVDQMSNARLRCWQHVYNKTMSVRTGNLHGQCCVYM